jgi:hypothetical protein
MHASDWNSETVYILLIHAITTISVNITFDEEKRYFFVIPTFK